MSEETIVNPVSPDAAPNSPDVSKPVRRFDVFFKRNVLIVGGVALLGVAAIAVVVVSARAKLHATGSQVAATTIPISGLPSAGKPSDLTPVDEARLDRVHAKESEAARAKNDTYIPKELPLTSGSLAAPDSSTKGPGSGYNYNSGAQNSAQYGQNNPSPADTQREARISRGIELQLAAIIARSEAPPTQSAPAYVSLTAPAAAATTTVAASSPADEAPSELVKGLTIAGARLVSPLDTSKTDFVSAEITSGPLTGAYLIGKGRMVGEEGVQITYTRMKFNEVTYAVNVTGLDNQTSSDALKADIDRKLLSRYVMPVVFTTFQAYLTAVARAPQEVVITSSGTAAVTSPAATAREAVAAGLAAGIGRAGGVIGQAKPSAFMPIDTSVALLFNDPVLKKVSK